jgi:hypothetical protein
VTSEATTRELASGRAATLRAGLDRLVTGDAG